MLFGHAHQREHDVGGQWEGQGGDQVELLLSGYRVEQAGGGGLDGGDHGGDAFHAERPGGRLAEPGVFGLVQADHAGPGLVAAREQDLLGLGRQRGHWRLGHGGRVAGRVCEYFLDVGVAGDDVVADRGGEEDGDAGLGQSGQDRVGVGEVLGRERVEGVVDGAAWRRHCGPPAGRVPHDHDVAGRVMLSPGPGRVWRRPG